MHRLKNKTQSNFLKKIFESNKNAIYQNSCDSAKAVLRQKFITLNGNRKKEFSKSIIKASTSGNQKKKSNLYLN